MKRHAGLWTAVALLAAAGISGGVILWRQHQGADRPVLRLYCGGTMRPAMEELIPLFEAEHHVRVEPHYDGCGVLVSQMKSGPGGDVFYACDSSFMDDAVDIGKIDTANRVVLTHFRPVIMVKKGNPRHIRTVDDLAQKGVKLGLGLETHGAVGRTGWRLIRDSPKFERIKANIVVEDPTADYLAAQLATTDNLDAVINWDVVARNYANKADMVPIGTVLADQPIAMMKDASQPELARRFIAFVQSDRAMEVFAKHGFTLNAATTRP